MSEKHSTYLEITNYHSADVDLVWEWNPSRLDEVFFQLSFEVSEKGQRGGTVFQVVIATPEGIRATFERFGPAGVPDRNLIVMCEYSWDAALDMLKSVVKKCECPSWEQSMEKLSRYFLWEYEDFQQEPDAEDNT